MSDRKSHGFDGFGFSGVGGGGGPTPGSFFGANSTTTGSTLRRMLSAVEPFTNTDKSVVMTSFGGGENVLENFTLQTNFHRQGQQQQQQQRAKRKRKESSFSSCSSSSSASTLLSLVAPPTSAERMCRLPPPTTSSVGSVGEENSFGVGGSRVAEEQSGQQKNGKSLSAGGGGTADLNESTSAGGGRVDYYNRSSEPAQGLAAGVVDEQTDSPRRKRPKYDYTRDQMFEIFQPWVIQTYGDRAKTKTITLKKQARIIKTLKGQEMNNPDSSKFRFWVKTKGFTTTKPKGFQDIFVFHNQEENDGCLLFAPNTTETDTQPYKKVAVVENFFNIIYGVHVSLGSRSTRHAGQKRTYRTITETYAFLPREAVTKFLSLCGQCSKALRPMSPIKLEDAAPTAASSPVCSVAEESFDDGAAVLPSPLARDTRGNSVVSSCFDSLASDEVYAKLMDCYKVQGGRDAGDRAGGNSSTYYQLLKTFYDNVKKREDYSAVESSRRVVEKSDVVEEDEEMVVDLTGTPDSDKASGRNSSKVPKTVVPEEEKEETSKSRRRRRIRSPSKAAVEVDDADDEEDDDVENGDVCSVGDGATGTTGLSSKELFASCEPTSEVSEKIRLNNNLDDKFDDSDGDSDASDGQLSRAESVPITSTYLELTRSMGVADDDALNMVSRWLLFLYSF